MAQEKKFDLAKVQPKDVAEIEKWESTQKDLVKQNPFIKITNNETYQEAKRRRTALRTGRTDIEKMDKSAGTFIRAFRDKIKNFATEMIGITLIHEENQQKEIDRWEEILERNRIEKERENEERIETIKSKISETERGFDEIIQTAGSDNLAEKQVEMETFFLKSKEDFNFEEYEFFVDEKHTEKQSELSQHVANLIKEENERKERESLEAENNLNKTIIEAQRVIDEYQIDSPVDLVAAVDAVFSENPGVNFGNEKYLNERKRFSEKANDHLLFLKMKQKDSEISKCKDFFNDLEDKIIRSEFDRFDENVSEVEKSISIFQTTENTKDIFDDLKPKVEKLISDKRNYIEKMIADEKKEIEIRTENRKKQIIEIGFVDSGDGFYTMNETFHVLFEQIETQTEDEWNDYIAGVEKSVETHKNNVERQNRLSEDKKNLLLWMDKMTFEIDDYFDYDGQIENEELKSFPIDVIAEIKAVIEKRKSQIEKF